jgi:hypothetical protein
MEKHMAKNVKMIKGEKVKENIEGDGFWELHWN